MQDSNPGSQTPNRQQTECMLTNRLSCRGSSKNWNSAARPYDQRAFSPLDPTASWLSHLALAIYILLLISMLWHRQAIFKSKGDKLSSSVKYRSRTQGLRHQIASWLNAHWQTEWAIWIKREKLSSSVECRIGTHGLQRQMEILCFPELVVCWTGCLIPYNKQPICFQRIHHGRVVFAVSSWHPAH